MEFYKDVENKFLKADELLSYNEYLKAKELLEEILDEEPDYGRAHNHMGVIYMQALSDYSRAEYFFRLAVKFAPEFLPAYYNYITVLLELEKVDKLDTLVKKALTVSGVDKAWIYHKIACAKEIQSDYYEAMKYLKLSRDQSLNDKWHEYLSKEKKRIRNKIGWFKMVMMML